MQDGCLFLLLAGAEIAPARVEQAAIFYVLVMYALI